jgi:uncharacterized protein YkwD
MRVVAFVATLTGALLAAPAAAPSVASAQACAGADAVGASAALELQSLRCLVNLTRAQHGLPLLRESRLLDRSADLRAGAIRRCSQFSHTPCGQGFTQVFARVGYLRANAIVAENLAWGGSSLGSPGATIAAWLRSPEHRANLLRRGMRDCGLALVRGRLFGSTGVSVWVLQLGHRV